MKEIGKIGFGTPALLSLDSERERQALLGAAFDAGITHFDTAPYYGYGEAERILGRFAVDRRDQITITTKFGIAPPSLPGGVSLVGTVKRLVKRFGPVRNILAKQAGKLVRRGAYGVEDARRSLEESLRSLRTEYIDVFLLHEGGAEDCTPELLAFLKDRKSAGVIVHFGVGSKFSKVNEVATRQRPFAGVLQFENSITRGNLQRLQCGSGGSFITHGALGQSFREVEQAVATDTSFRDLCSAALGANVMQQGILAAAMLHWARKDNPEGPVLFSSRSKQRVAAAVATLNDSAFADDQIARFADVIRNRFVSSCASD